MTIGEYVPKSNREVERMATKSILKAIHIKKKQSAYSLVNALDNACNKKQNEVTMSKSYATASRDEIRKMFGGADDRV